MIETLPDGVVLTGDDRPILAIETPAGTGEIHLDGAHVTRWAPTGAREVLWVSEYARFEPGVAIRGGIPLCAPWFGPGRAKNRTPSHGFFRVVRWDCSQVRRDGDEVTVVLTLPDLADVSDVPGVESSPADLRATCTVTMGSTLRVELQITSPTAPLELENALHAYLAVSDVREVRVEGLDGARYVDKAPGGRAVNAQSGPVEFRRLTDRVYASQDEVVLVDEGAGRRIRIAKEGSKSTVVWNPWERGAAQLADFGDDEWPGMLCVEPANALAGHVALAAGETHTTAATFAVDSF